MCNLSFSTTGVEVVHSFSESANHKTILITGPSENGIGAEIAISLAHANPNHLLLAGRSEAKAEPVIRRIQELNASVKVTFVSVDLGSLNSVREAAALVSGLVEEIDIIINNAAIMACPYSKTKDGIESQFATNYLGHFLLTNLLLGRVMKAGRARIINTTSTGGAGGSVDFAEVNFEDGRTYVPVAAYAQSKVAMMLFSVALARRFDPQRIASFSVHPGNIMTNLQVHLQDPDALKSAIEWIVSKTSDFKREDFKTLQQGCSTALVAALDPSLTASSGSYLADARIAYPQPTPSLDNSETAEKLWTLSEELVGQKFEWRSK